MTRVITALRSPINKTVSSRCDPKPGSSTGDAVQFSVGRQTFPWDYFRFARYPPMIGSRLPMAISIPSKPTFAAA